MAQFDWQTSGLTLTFLAEDDGPVRLVDIRGAEDAPGDHARASQPLVEILTPELGLQGHSHSGRHSGTELGAALRLVRHFVVPERGRDRLVVEQHDPHSGVTTATTFESAGAAAVRTSTTVTLSPGAAPLTLWAVTSFSTGAVISDHVPTLDVWRGTCTWSAENRWSAQPLQAPGLARTTAGAPGENIRSTITAAATSTWSSGAYVPAGAVQDRTSGRTLAWQVEHNGPWLWEVGEHPAVSGAFAAAVGAEEAAGPPQHDRSRDGAYVAVLGPTDLLHHWSLPLDAGGSFSTVPVTFTVAASFDAAFSRLADHRRATRRSHPQNTALPVIFNDYMDTLEGDPTEAKLLPLIDAAAAVGCDYFCIDAGWYDDTAGWWASVGDWRPSTVRFPRGIGFVLDHIRSSGMVPGLWLEPEVVGLTSVAAQALPDTAFLQRGGVRVRERDRYFLDLRSPDARAHLDEAVDRLVSELGIGYFKLDYNVTPGAGTDWDSVSVGEGLLEHNRALVSWLGTVLDRHPDLVLENCGSGALRSDFAMLSTLQLQSTSDQQDPLLYPAIAVGALVHVLPEQAANWSYPQATMSPELIAFNQCTGLAGRLYQSGLLDRMDTDQLALVTAGVQAHKDTVAILARSAVRFPTGLPGWDDAWVSVAFEAPEQTLVLAWRQQHAGPEVDLELPGLPAGEVEISQVYPPVDVLPEWGARRTDTGLTLSSGATQAAARMLRITARTPAQHT